METNYTCQCTKEPLPIEDNFNVKIPSTLISCEPSGGHSEQVCLINWFLASDRCSEIFTSTMLLILYVILYHLTSSSLHCWYWTLLMEPSLKRCNRGLRTLSHVPVT